MPETAETYEKPEHGWTCFHCGETFTTVGAARNHFGGDIWADPGCMIRVQVGEERGLLMELRKREEEVRELRAANEQMDHEVGSYHAMIAELERLFDGARSAHQAWLKYEAMEGRALAAEEQAERLQAELRTPM